VGSGLCFDSEYFCVSAIWRWATGDVLKAIFYLAKPYMVSHFFDISAPNSRGFFMYFLVCIHTRKRRQQ
jgi:hypothetical protein